VVVATAERERDREKRASGRLILAVSLAGGLVLTFGGLALRRQRQELELTRRLELAEAVRERDERLQRLSKAATTLTLASGFAHELGTPLAVIVGRAEQLAPRVVDDERATRSVQAILEQAGRIHELMRGFLSLARGGKPSFEAARPAALVEGAMGLVEHRFSKAGVRLKAVVPEGLPTLVCDLRLMEHAIVNLLLNACDASPPGATVEVRVDAAGGKVRLCVLDEGAGIPKEDAARVTQPFFTTKPQGRGTGLGLSIASEIAKSHHGTLALERGEQRGTRAVLELPLTPGGEANG
jgi:signal transduction histidine kinase